MLTVVLLLVLLKLLPFSWNNVLIFVMFSLINVISFDKRFDLIKSISDLTLGSTLDLILNLILVLNSDLIFTQTQIQSLIQGSDSVFDSILGLTSDSLKGSNFDTSFNS